MVHIHHIKQPNENTKFPSIEEHIAHTLHSHEYIDTHKLICTLQGQVWKARVKTEKFKKTSKSDMMMNVVIKCAKKDYYSNDKSKTIGDNMLEEYRILQSLSKCNPPPG